MGDWSSEPWGNDEAADWFHKFWSTKDVDLIVNDIRNFDPENERYDSIRAACHILVATASPYVWPVDRREDRLPTISKAIEILESMINPPNDSWSFLEIWEHDEDVIKSVRGQIASLKEFL